MALLGGRTRQVTASGLFSQALREWERGALRSALTLLETLEEQFPLEEIPAAALLKAEVFSELGSFKDARREAERVLKVDPASFRARIVLGRALMELGNHLEALDHLKTGSVLYPWADEARGLLSQLRKRMKEGTLSGASKELVEEVKELTGEEPDETSEG